MEYIKKGQIGLDFTNQIVKDTPKNYTLEFSASAETLTSVKNNWENFKVFNWSSFFPNNVAEVLHNYYFNKHKDDWDLVIHPDPYHNYGNVVDTEPVTEEGYYHMYLTKDNDPTVPERLKYAKEILNTDGFSYAYRRTLDFHPYLSWFGAQKFINIVENITGYSNLTYLPNYSFVSCYEEGHWNGPHTDGDNGRVAMVYHLSKDWKPYFGGVFMRMNWNNDVVNKAVNPPFNTLTMFNVEGGAPHFVSEVVQGIRNKRIAFTAWYQ